MRFTIKRVGLAIVGLVFAVEAGSALPILWAYWRPHSAFVTDTRICYVDTDAIYAKAQASQNANAQLRDLRVQYQKSVDELKGQIDATGGHPPPGTPDLQAQVNAYNQQFQATRSAATQSVNLLALAVTPDTAHAVGCAAIIAKRTLVDLGSTVDVTQPIINAMDAKETRFDIAPPVQPGQ